MKKEYKSAILNIVVQIVSNIREESRSQEEIGSELKLVERYLRNISISNVGEVHAIFSDQILRGDND